MLSFRQRLRALAVESRAAGDEAQFTLCQRALQGDPRARRNCEEVLREAASLAYHDHPNNPTSCEAHLAHYGQRCPCEEWRGE